MSTPLRSDVAIIGAGPAGAAAAIWLARAGCRVALLERSHFETPRIGESLAPSVRPLLAEMGVWAEFVALSSLPSYGMRSVWGSTEVQEYSHVMTPYGVGYHVDRVTFDRMLAERAIAAGAELHTGVRVVRCLPPENGSWTLFAETSSGDALTFTARIVIDAAGRNSPFSVWGGAQRAVFDKLIGVVCEFAHTSAADQCYLLVETCADGWWYSAPVGPGRLVAMLMTDGDLPAAANTKLYDAWIGSCQQARSTHDRIGSGKLTWGPRIFSAVSQRVIRGEFESLWLSVGDAALSVDPISGSGVFRALRTAKSCAETALAILRGEQQAIMAYECARNEECTSYLQERAAYYALERRWHHSMFWKRRLSPETGKN